MTLTAPERAEPMTPLDGTRSTPAVRLCVVSLERTTRPGQALSDTDRCRPQQFRRLSCALLTSWDLLGHIASVELLVTELLTNALQHGEGPEVDVMISADEDYLHVFVRDGSPHTPDPRARWTWSRRTAGACTSSPLSPTRSRSARTAPPSTARSRSRSVRHDRHRPSGAGPHPAGGALDNPVHPPPSGRPVRPCPGMDVSGHVRLAGTSSFGHLRPGPPGAERQRVRPVRGRVDRGPARPYRERRSADRRHRPAHGLPQLRPGGGRAARARALAHRPVRGHLVLAPR